MAKITFIDQVGRTIYGEEIERTSSTLTVKNPAMINVNQTQNGQLQVQLYPLFFSEFIDQDARDKGTHWRFNLSQITVCLDVMVDNRLNDQYDRVFGNPVAPVEPKTIKLFDE